MWVWSLQIFVSNLLVKFKIQEALERLRIESTFQSCFRGLKWPNFEVMIYCWTCPHFGDSLLIQLGQIKKFSLPSIKNRYFVFKRHKSNSFCQQIAWIRTCSQVWRCYCLLPDYVRLWVNRDGKRYVCQDHKQIWYAKSEK